MPQEKQAPPALHVFKVDFSDGSHRNVLAEKAGDISFKLRDLNTPVLRDVTGVQQVAGDVTHLDDIEAPPAPKPPAKKAEFGGPKTQAAPAKAEETPAPAAPKAPVK